MSGLLNQNASVCAEACNNRRSVLFQMSCEILAISPSILQRLFREIIIGPFLVLCYVVGPHLFSH